MKLKLNNTGSKTSDPHHHSYSKSPAKQFTVMHNMQIMRSKIDHHLTTSYQRLSLNSNTSSNNNTNSKCRVNNKEIMINLKRNKNVSANSQYNKISVMEHRQACSLISNKDVMQYIQLVYQMYNIKDPLFSQRDDQTEITQSTIQKDRAKMEPCFDEEINSARTTKAYPGNIVEVSQFDIDQQNTARNTIKRNNKIVITLRSKTATKKYEKKINPLMNRNPFNNIAKQQKQQFKDQQFPLFRYCFACEEPIYQKNILRHEDKCHQLKLSYSYSFQTILLLLDQKIQRLKDNINKQIIQVGPQQISHRYKQLQNSIKKWISLVPNKFNYLDNELREREYLKLKEKMNWNKNLQLLNRLNWFLRLRENIFNHYNPNQIRCQV